MNLQKRIELLAELGNYIRNDDAEWIETKLRAERENPWFTREFIGHASDQIAGNFLDKDQLIAWASHYHLDDNILPRNTGIVMAGNIPLVGFHDFLCVFISGHKQTIKLSSKDQVLLKHLVEKMKEWEPGTADRVGFAEMLKGCDAYIATGSNNSARYFEQYFSRYPNIIRRNRTSVAILSGNETEEELARLSDDIHLYFGLGCRNVTKLYVPEGYDFIPLLKSFDRYKWFADNFKYKNNYDYQLSIALLNNVYYMTNGSTLLIENASLTSPISQLNYGFYSDPQALAGQLNETGAVQCLVGHGYLPFGKTQCPRLMDYADGADTLQFLLSL